MPDSLYGAPAPDMDSLDANAGSLPTDPGAAAGLGFRLGFDPRPAWRTAVTLGRGISDAYAGQAGEAPVTPPKISADDANARYGQEGLRFNAPVYEDDAAFQSQMASQRQFHDWLAQTSNISPLYDIGAQLAGGLLNPANLGLAAITGPIGEGAGAALGIGRTAEGVLVASRLGRVANTLGEGLLVNAPFVAANAGIANAQGEDYGAADGLRDLAIGAVLHTGFHYAGSAIGAKAEGPHFDEAPIERPQSPAFTPDPAPAAGVPEAVANLPETSRLGAFVKAVDDMADDVPVDVGGLVARENQAPSLDRLDEPSALPALDGFRPLDTDAAVTPRGAEVPVRFGLAELASLSTSHTDDLQVNPDYPPELQPRDRARAGAQARNYQLEQELNPKLLINDVSAGAGAPIVAPDGTVESGNGRVIALRRSAASGTPAYRAYQAELAARGFDTTGMTAPALVRMRTEPMTGAARAALAREMNADVTERMGGVEQAMADAARLPNEAFDQVKPNETPATSRDFARAFIAKAAPDQANVLAAADGSLSPEGARRIKAAVLARAYGDPRLVAQVFEGEETAARKLAEGVADAAPAWAALRAAVAKGEVPAELDLTGDIGAAMDLVREAKAEGRPLAALLGERADQLDMFGGDALRPQAEAMLRMMFRDAALEKPEAPARIAAALRYYATEALKVKPGPDLFGATPGEETSRQILENLAKRYATGDAGDLDARAPGRASDAAAERAARPAVVDVRPDGAGGERPAGEGVPGEPGDGAGQRSAGAGDKRLKPSPRGELQPPSGELARKIARVEDVPLSKVLATSADREWDKFNGGQHPPPTVEGFGERPFVVRTEDGSYHLFDGHHRVDLALERGDASMPMDVVDAKDLPGGDKAAQRTTAESVIAADPELKALAEETDRLAAENGIELGDDAPRDDPKTIAEAVRAAAVCLTGELG